MLTNSVQTNNVTMSTPIRIQIIKLQMGPRISAPI